MKWLLEARLADWTMPLVLIVIILWIARSLMLKDRDHRSRFSFEALLLDPVTGETDPARFIMVGSWGFLSWGFILISMRGTAGALEIIAYGFVCFAPMVMKIYRIQVTVPNVPGLQTGGSTVTTVTETKVEPMPAQPPPAAPSP